MEAEVLLLVSVSISPETNSPLTKIIDVQVKFKLKLNLTNLSVPQIRNDAA
jgi:hypothetical protein